MLVDADVEKGVSAKIELVTIIRLTLADLAAASSIDSEPFTVGSMNISWTSSSRCFIMSGIADST